MLQLFRGKNQRNKSTTNAADWASETVIQPLDAVSNLGQLSDRSCGVPGSESHSTVLLSNEQQNVKKVIIFPLLTLFHLKNQLESS